jgi:hypothetical protein
VTFIKLKEQIELLRLRRQASRIAVRLYEAATGQEDIDTINTWFDVCNQAQTGEDVKAGIEALMGLARNKDITIDL